MKISTKAYASLGITGFIAIGNTVANTHPDAIEMNYDEWSIWVCIKSVIAQIEADR